MFVTTQDGFLYRVTADQPEVVLDLSSRVSDGFEQGLFSAVSSAEHGEMYLHFTDLDGDTAVVAYTYDAGEIEPDSERLVLAVDQPKETHNGGQLVMDGGHLWISLGDGGAGALADPHDPGFSQNAQRLDSLHGSILRAGSLAPPVAKRNTAWDEVIGEARAALVAKHQ